MELNISNKDHQIISRLINSADIRTQNKELRQLSAELKKMKIHPEPDPAFNFIGLNSEVSIKELSSGKLIQFTITTPSLADPRKRRLSVFAPLSIAVLGCKEGDSIEWELPGGLKKMKVMNVKNPH